MSSYIEILKITIIDAVSNFMYHLHKNAYFHSPFFETSISIVNKILRRGVIIIKT